MRLKKMFGPDRAAEREFLLEYLEKTLSLIDQLRAALISGQAAQVEMLAHRGKGASANFGIQVMIEPLERLEAAARSADLSNAPQLLTEIEASFALAQKAVKTRPEFTKSE
jgi:HPt (histidine-containing phosphotransfer) domain-containing protein